MKILHNTATLNHRTQELVNSRLIPAHESPERIHSILTALDAASYPLTVHNTDILAAESAASKIHTPAYLTHLKTIYHDYIDSSGASSSDSSCSSPTTTAVLPECFPVHSLNRARLKEPRDVCARVGYYAFDMSTGISEGTYESAIAAADLARRGAEELVSGEGEGVVVVLCRPPGHHCAEDLMGGYCYLNNAAIAVRTLMELREAAGEMVTVLDLDFHHGNGTQAVFWECRNPGYVSIHGEDEYPYFTGSRDEIGEGEGEGYTRNLPVKCGATWSEYEPAFEEALEVARKWGTEWLVVSLGFDTFYGDPVGKFCLTREDYEVMGKGVGALGLKTLVVLEGGYVIEELGNNFVAFLRGMEEGIAGR